MNNPTESYHWHQALNKALKRNRREAHNRYFQLATLGTDGRPRNRTVVFRGFAQDDESLLIITDRRSRKREELIHCPHVEVSWYFTISREQFRLSGCALCVEEGNDAQALRPQVWQGLSDAAREQFFWPDPARPLGEGEVPNIADDGLPSSFCVLRVIPEQVDHLKLGASQTRLLSVRSDDGWLTQAINP